MMQDGIHLVILIIIFMLLATMEYGVSVIDSSKQTFRHQDSLSDIFQVGRNQRKSKNEFIHIIIVINVANLVSGRFYLIALYLGLEISFLV